MKRLGKYTILFERCPVILGHAAVGGKKEAEGPLARDFDQTFLDSYLAQESWEKAESMLQTEAATLAIRKAGLEKSDISMIFAGDLLNQCISSTFGLREMDIPFLGQYGACSTMAQTLLMSAVAVESGAANYACAVTSSHFCTAERQFRTPLEYGCQRTPTAQWTATASGSAVLGYGQGVRVRRATVGRIKDFGVTDVANMGAAMAPRRRADTARLLRRHRDRPRGLRPHLHRRPRRGRHRAALQPARGKRRAAPKPRGLRPAPLRPGNAGRARRRLGLRLLRQCAVRAHPKPHGARRAAQHPVHGDRRADVHNLLPAGREHSGHRAPRTPRNRMILRRRLLWQRAPLLLSRFGRKAYKSFKTRPKR